MDPGTATGEAHYDPQYGWRVWPTGTVGRENPNNPNASIAATSRNPITGEPGGGMMAKPIFGDLRPPAPAAQANTVHHGDQIMTEDDYRRNVLGLPDDAYRQMSNDRDGFYSHGGGMTGLAAAYKRWNDQFKDRFSLPEYGQLGFAAGRLFGDMARQGKIGYDQAGQWANSMSWDPQYDDAVRKEIANMQAERGRGAAGFGVQQPVRQPTVARINSHAAGRLGTRSGVAPVGLMSNRLARK